MDWHEDKLKLKKSHTWKAPPGYQVFVADRGAVKFNFPQHWVMEFDSDCTRLHDQKPPDHKCRLAFSYVRLPPIDWSGLSLSKLIETATDGDPRGLEKVGADVLTDRPDIELAWAEFRFYDPAEKRDALTRISIARGSDIQSLITLDFRPDDGAWLGPIWDEVMRSLELGKYVEDPTHGDVIN